MSIASIIGGGKKSGGNSNWGKPRDPTEPEIEKEESPFFHGETRAVKKIFESDPAWEIMCQCKTPQPCRIERTNKKKVFYKNPVLNPDKSMKLAPWVVKKMDYGSIGMFKKVADTWEAPFKTCGQFYLTCAKSWTHNRDFEAQIAAGEMEPRCDIFMWWKKHPHWEAVVQAIQANDEAAKKLESDWAWTLLSRSQYDPKDHSPEIKAMITEMLMESSEAPPKDYRLGVKKTIQK